MVTHFHPVLPAIVETMSERTSTEDGEKVNLLYTEHIDERKHLNSRSRLYFWVRILLQTFLVSYAFIISVLYLHQKSQRQCLLGQEAIYDNPPRQTRTVKFQQAGFHDEAHKDRTIYEGRPDGENNDAWDRLMSGVYMLKWPLAVILHLSTVGVVAISAAENDRLVEGSAKSQRNKNEYVVELEVFHQLHCLVSSGYFFCSKSVLH